MAYIVELRDANTWRGDDVIGFIGETGRGMGVVRKITEAALFDSPYDADRILRRLPDEFFDRYVENVVEASDDLEIEIENAAS
jgi:hypothetical protein